MKKGLRITFFITGFLILASALYYSLLPERSNKSIIAIKRSDSSENETYRKDVLAEHRKRINEKVAEELKQVHASAQMNLMVIESAIKTYGSHSKEVQTLVEVKDMQDSINLKKVTGIIDKYGWLGAEQIGALNNYTLFATIQNADLATQEKYIPVMRQAVSSGTLSAENFANLVDRKALVQHQQQIYGTVLLENSKEHTYMFAPIVDEQTVNERRKEIGLSTIEEYAKVRGITYSGVRSEG